MRENVKEICATCKNAVYAGRMGFDMYFCDQLLGPLCELADCPAPTHVLVAGSEVGCLDYYERDPDAFDRVWKHELEEEDDMDVALLMFWGQDGSRAYRDLPEGF